MPLRPSIVDRSPVIIKPDPTRTVVRPFSPGDPAPFARPDHPRAQRIADRVLALTPGATETRLEDFMRSLSERHRDVAGVLDRRYSEIKSLVAGREIGRDQARLIAAYLLEEYSFEAAALFNPSMVLHWDQSRGTPDTTPFVMALRGIGEGHVSSVTFRTGRWSATEGFTIDHPSSMSVSPVIDMMGGSDDEIMATLHCGGSESLSETVLFPILPSQARGIEDMRLVRFIEQDGTCRYLGTYSAFDGTDVRQELLETVDFRTFTMRRIGGVVADAKGLAIFPRQIGGRYYALSRHDSENIWLMVSDSLYEWNDGERLLSPEYDWEFVQLGNCGSPLEIEEGWLVLTHGVGALRNYTMGACLLDRDDPSRVLRRTALPVLEPAPEDRGGYVPNVVYSCGGMICGRTLLLPYGVADNLTTFATVELDHLLAGMDPV